MAPENFIHILFNNGAHESVGGQPTLGFEVDFLKIADAFNYKSSICAQTKDELTKALAQLDSKSGPILIEIKVGINSRKDLSRPKIHPVDNKINFMKNISHGRER